MLKSRLDSRCSGLTDDQIRHGLGEKQKRTTVSLFTVLSVHNLFLKQVPITRGTDQVGGCVSIPDTRYTAGDRGESEGVSIGTYRRYNDSGQTEGTEGIVRVQHDAPDFTEVTEYITSDGYTKQVAT